MAEETLSEALSKLDDDNINSAALPEGKRVEEEVQDDATYIEFSEEEMEDISPVTEDSVKEDFDASEVQGEEELSEAEVRARTAQNRINQAVKQAKDYQRRELQALQYAKELQEQNEQLASQLKNTQTSTAEQNLKMQETYSGEFATRVDTQAEAAKRHLKTAYESGDPEAMADAQQLLAKAEADRNALAQYQRDLEQYKVNYADWLEQQKNDIESNQYAQQDPYAGTDYEGMTYEEPEYQEPSQRAQQWAIDNPWFGEDEAMTDQAMSIHRRLAATKIDTESDEYYSELNKRLREAFPHKFDKKNTARGNNNVQTVVSGSRTTGSGRNQNSRRVELNPSEQALARKLGVPFKEYAKQKMRLQNS